MDLPLVVMSNPPGWFPAKGGSACNVPRGLPGISARKWLEPYESPAIGRNCTSSTYEPSETSSGTPWSLHVPAPAERLDVDEIASRAQGYGRHVLGLSRGGEYGAIRGSRLFRGLRAMRWIYGSGRYRYAGC